MTSATGDRAGALDYAYATADLAHLTLVTLSAAMARQAAELAGIHPLRGSDAVYLAVARRYATTLLTRDDEQLSRGSAIVTCQTPGRPLHSRVAPKARRQRVHGEIGDRAASVPHKAKRGALSERKSAGGSPASQDQAKRLAPARSIGPEAATVERRDVEHALEASGAGPNLVRDSA